MTNKMVQILEYWPAGVFITREYQKCLEITGEFRVQQRHKK